MTLTAKDVAEITKLLEESSFDELYLELDGVKLSLRRSGTGAGAAVPLGGPQPVSDGAKSGVADSVPGASAAPAGAAPSSSGAAATASPSGHAAAAAPAADPNVHDVPAPLLGTFYRAPKPGAPPFVEVGTSVEEETVIGIIEVMKLMNTVRAGVRGQVAEILARDGALVEYGETLLRVSKTG